MYIRVYIGHIYTHIYIYIYIHIYIPLAENSRSSPAELKYQNLNPNLTPIYH